MPNPRKHCGKRDSDVMESDYPIATTDMLRDFQRLEKSHREDEVRRDVFSLIAARKALGDAKIAVGDALRYQKNENVIGRLKLQLELLDNDLHDFPLKVL